MSSSPIRGRAWKDWGRRLILAAPILLLVVGCGGAPEIDAPLPERRSAVTEEQFPLPLASLAAPVVLDLTGILERLEEAVPLSFGDIEDRIPHPENDRVQIAFLAERSPFTAELHGDEARISASFEYQLRAWYDPPLLPQVSFSCGTAEGDIRPRAAIELRSPLSIGGDWTLRSESRVVRVEPLTSTDRDRCEVTPLGIDLTGTVMNAAIAHLSGLTGRIDEKVAEVGLRSKLEGVWRTLQEPHELTDGVWLMIDPVGVSHASPVGEGTTVTIPVGLTARPRIVVGPRPEIVFRELPGLERDPVPEEALIMIEGVAPYEAIAEQLSAQLDGHEIHPAGNVFRIRQIAVHGIGDGRVAIEVNFEGTARGRVFFVGTPRLNIATRMIEVPDLELDIETRHLLVGGLAWISRGGLEEIIRERARIPVGDLMDLAEDQLDRGINRRLSDEVTVEGVVLGSDLLDARTGDTGVVVRAAARVRALLRIRE